MPTAIVKEWTIIINGPNPKVEASKDGHSSTIFNPISNPKRNIFSTMPHWRFWLELGEICVKFQMCIPSVHKNGMHYNVALESYEKIWNISAFLDGPDFLNW